jgi:hypothetical protein
MTASGSVPRTIRWMCRPSLGRALLCGFGAVYLGTFIGVDAVTMFCAAQVARLVLRAVARRRVRVGLAFLMPWWDRLAVEPIEPDADPGLAIAERYNEIRRAPVPASDPEPEFTLDELIAGDPGPEPGDPGPTLEEVVGLPSRGPGDEAAPIAAGADRHGPAVSAALEFSNQEFAYQRLLDRRSRTSG